MDLQNTHLKGTVSRDFLLLVFYESVSSPRVLGPFPIFLKIRGDIRKSRCTIGINGIIRGLGETDPCRKPEFKNLVELSL